MLAFYKCPKCGEPNGGQTPNGDITMDLICSACGNKMSIEDMAAMAAQPFEPGGICGPQTPKFRTTIRFDGVDKFIFRIGGQNFRVSLASLTQLMKDANIAIIDYMAKRTEELK